MSLIMSLSQPVQLVLGSASRLGLRASADSLPEIVNL